MEKLSEFGYKSCVYCIENTKNGRVYIGQTKQFPTRIFGHFHDLIRHKHCTERFQDEFDEYGEDSFVVYVLEECTPELLGDREYYWMRQYNRRLLNKHIKNA